VLWEILRGRDFRRLYATRLTSQFTDGVFQVALAGYVFFSPERQTSAGKAAAAFAVTLLPYSVLGPFVGVFIDRWQRRQILVWTPVARAALVLVIAALVAAGEDGAVFFAGVLVVLGINRFFLASLSAGLPQVVLREQLVTANALSVTSGTVIAFVGAGAGYGLRRVFGAEDPGTAMILVVASGTWLLAGLVATLLPRRVLGPHLEEVPEHTREALRDVVHGLADGARHILRRRLAALGLAVLSFNRFLYGVILIMTLLLCRNHFNTDPEAGLATFATMLGVSGAGFFAAALITPIVVKRISKQAWIAWLLGAGAVSMLVLGAPFTETAWAAGGFALGVVSQGIKLCVDTILQESIEDAYRGRVFAVHDMLFNAIFAAGAALAAAWLPMDGVSYPTLLTVVAAYGLGAVIYRTTTSWTRHPNAVSGKSSRR
jgi:MFS family permease